MNKLWFYVSTTWQTILATTVVAALVVSLLLFHVGTLTPGAHLDEVTTSKHNPSFTSVIREPINAPYYGARDVVRKIAKHPSLTTSRVVTAAFGLVAVGAFYGLLSLWFRPRVAFLGLILFATSGWFLRLTRLAVPDILGVLSITLVLFWAWLQRTQKPHLAFIVSGLAVTALLYVPGMVWLIIPAALWRGKYLFRLGKVSGLMITGCFLVGALLLAPLVYYLVRQPIHLLDLAGIPRHVAVRTLLHNAVLLPIRLVIRGPADPRLTVGNAPILDVFTATMAILGIYSNVLSWKLDRSKLVLGLLVLGTAMSVLNTGSLLGWLIAPIYLLAISGIAFLLEEWFRVFPRNPLARGIAATLVSLAVLFTAYYQVTNYFIAWPNAPTTKTTFSHRL